PIHVDDLRCDSRRHQRDVARAGVQHGDCEHSGPVREARDGGEAGAPGRVGGAGMKWGQGGRLHPRPPFAPWRGRMAMLPLERPDCQREREAAWREQELAYDLSVLLRAARLALAAGEQGGTKLLVSAANARAAAVAGSVAAFGVRSLAAAVGVLSGQLAAEPTAAGIDEEFARLNAYDVDCADGRGQEFAKR